MLWYWADWHSGTATMTRHLKGCYIDVLHAQFNSGRLSLEEIRVVLGSDFGSSWPAIQKKFTRDENGMFFNERLELEKEKRKAYTESRKKNRTAKHPISGTYDKHMIPHMDNENGNAVPAVSGNGGMGERDFFTNRAWKEQFCMAKKIQPHDLDRIQKQFMDDVRLKGENPVNLKSYFTNWFNRHQDRLLRDGDLTSGGEKKMVY